MSRDDVGRWRSELADLTRAYRDRIDDLTPEELNRKPGPDAWSVGQILEHLIVTNRSYRPEIRKLREGRGDPPWYARFRSVVRLAGRLVLRAVEPERRRKVKTFPVWEPGASDVEPDVVDRFVAQQEELASLIGETADLVARGAVVRSPALPLLVYELGTAFEILVTHEKRHLAQVDETLEAVGAAR